MNFNEIKKTIDELQRPGASNKYAPVELNIKRWEALDKCISKLVACSENVTLEEFEEVLSYQGGYLQSLVNKGYYGDLANVTEDKRAALENEKLESEGSHSGDHDANNVQADTNDNITRELTELHFVDNHFASSSDGS